MPRIIIGDKLGELAKSKSHMERRNCLKDLLNYLSSNPQGRACVLFGLRRTGKTTLIMHALLDKPEIASKSAYVLCDGSDTMASTLDAVDKLAKKMNLRHIFMDEATNMPDFTATANILADDYALRDIHVVLSGTHSLGFHLAKSDSLYDRCDFIKTTRIPFHEHVRLLGTKNIDDYLQTGGILSPNAQKLFLDYTIDAIAKNIQHSLKYFNGGDFGDLFDLYQKNKLTGVINKIINDQNHSFLLKTLKEEFTFPDFTKAVRFLSSEGRQLASVANYDDQILNAMENFLEIKKESLKDWNQAELNSLKYYFHKLDFIKPRIELTANDIVNRNRQRMFAKLDNDISCEEWFDEEKPYKEVWLLTQPGLRWAQVELLLDTLQKRLLAITFEPNALQNIDIERFQELSEEMFKSIRDNALGNILEEAVTLELEENFGEDYYVFKFKRYDNEIDIVMAAKNFTHCHLIEVKHSYRQRGNYCDNICDLKNEKIISGTFGKVESRSIIYNGEDQDKLHTRKNNQEVQYSYLNATDFLLKLPAGQNLNELLKISESATIAARL